MEYVKKLEDMIEGWLKPVPHLPAAWRKWMAENVWWLVIISVVLEVFAVIGMYNAAMLITNNPWYGYLEAYGAPSHAGMTLYTMVTMAFLAVSAVLMAMAVNPLKAKHKKGWDLLFLATLVGVASSLAGAVLGLSFTYLVSGIFSAVIGAAIGSYFLFEIRSYFKK
jgi:uncharacterized membrane protein